MEPPVTITFDCTPLRSVSRFDSPLGASPACRKRLEQFQDTVTKHDTRDTYYLTDAVCQFRFTNNPEMITSFKIEFSIDSRSSDL